MQELHSSEGHYFRWFLLAATIFCCVEQADEQVLSSSCILCQYTVFHLPLCRSTYTLPDTILHPAVMCWIFSVIFAQPTSVSCLVWQNPPSIDLIMENDIIRYKVVWDSGHTTAARYKIQPLEGHKYFLQDFCLSNDVAGIGVSGSSVWMSDAEFSLLQGYNSV